MEKVLDLCHQEKVNGKIAKEAGIGVGTVTAIVNESGANRDYYDMYLLGRLQWCEDKKPRTLAILRFPLDLDSHHPTLSATGASLS